MAKTNRISKKLKRSKKKADNTEKVIKRTRAYMRNYATRLRKTSTSIHEEHYAMGELLYEALEHRYWKEWHSPSGVVNYTRFEDWAYDETGITARKAHYLVDNYSRLAALKVTKSSPEFHECMRLGWSKLDIVLKLGTNRREFKKWLRKVKAENLSKRNLKSIVRATQSADRRGLTATAKIKNPLWQDLARTLAQALDKADHEDPTNLSELLTQAQAAVKQLEK